MHIRLIPVNPTLVLSPCGVRYLTALWPQARRSRIAVFDWGRHVSGSQFNLSRMIWRDH
jgi:hypothetical protein